MHRAPHIHILVAEAGRNWALLTYRPGLTIKNNLRMFKKICLIYNSPVIHALIDLAIASCLYNYVVHS